MALCFFSLDYLVEVIQRLHQENIITKSQFHNRTGINVIIGRLSEAGLIRQNKDPAVQSRYYTGLGRQSTLYQLNCDYRSICIGHLFPLLTKIDRHEEHVCRLMAYLPLCQLADARLPSDLSASSLYSATKMLDMLFRLSTDTYTCCDDMISIVSQLSHRRAILSDLVKSGVVEVKRGEGYRLKESLTQVPVSKLLPLMYSRSARKKTYNALIYLMRDTPIAQLKLSRTRLTVKEMQ